MTDSAPSDTQAYVICGVRDIPNRRGKSFQLIRREADGTERPWSIFLVRWDRKLHGFVNNCPHHGVNLDWEQDQFFDGLGPRVVCGKHGSLFDIATGTCVDGPCLGRRLEPVPLRIIDGDICVVGVNLAEDDLHADASAA